MRRFRAVRICAALAMLEALSTIAAPSPALADQRMRESHPIDRNIFFEGTGCGVIDDSTIRLASRARNVVIDTPVVGDAVIGDVDGQTIGRVRAVFQGDEDGVPTVTVSMQSSDAACDPANTAARTWSGATAVEGSYDTMEKVYVTGTGRGDKRRYKPSFLLFGFRSAIVNLRWTDWGSPKAIGRGEVEYNSCNPDCARARPVYFPVRASLTKRRKCDGYFQYRVLNFRYTTSRRPPGLPATYRETFPC
jgi:hypothetical protein